MFTLGGMPIVGNAVLGRVRSLPPERIVAVVLSLCCADCGWAATDIEPTDRNRAALMAAKLVRVMAS